MMQRLLILLVCSFGPAQTQGYYAGSPLLQSVFSSRVIPCLTTFITAQNPKATGQYTAHLSPVWALGNYQKVEVYFPALNRIVLWEPRVLGSECLDLVQSRRDWDLRDDVQSDIQGSTYLLSTREARAMVRRCLGGDRVVLRFAKGKLIWANVSIT